MQSKPVHEEIEVLLNQYNKNKKKLFSEIRAHSSDFIVIRIEFTLAKLKTYLGLARVSDFSVTKEQWIEWHDHESTQILTDLFELLQSIPSSP